MQSPFGGWRHHLARWEACHWIRGSQSSPMNPVPLPPPQFGGAAKGKRLNGQARRLTSSHLEVLCRTSTGDYKAPLCCELLMKGLLFRVLLSHRSAGGRWCRKAPKGGSHRRWLITVVHIIPYDTESKSRNADFISIARRAIHNPRPARPSNLRTLRTFGAQPRQSSRHRRVQWRSRIGGGERSEPIRRMPIMPYGTER